jgi:hypothetical protein
MGLEPTTPRLEVWCAIQLRYVGPAGVCVTPSLSTKPLLTHGAPQP